MKNASKITEKVTLDHLFAWAQKNPELLDQWLDQQVEDIIKNAPEKHRRRLRGLQFQIDMERKKSHTSMACCIRISQLMYDSFFDLQEALKNKSPKTSLSAVQHVSTETAEVLDLSIERKKRKIPDTDISPD